MLKKGFLVINASVKFCDASSLNMDNGSLTLVFHDSKAYPVAAWA